MVLPNFNRMGGAPPAQAPNQQQAAPAQASGQQQQQAEPVDWTRGWKMPENNNQPVLQEFIGRLRKEQGMGKIGKTFGNQRREFMVLHYDWVFPIQVRKGFTFDAEKGLRLEVPMSASPGSGMGMFRASVCALSGIAAVNTMLQDKLWEFQDNDIMMHMVSVDNFSYGTNSTSGEQMKGLIWQLVDLYKEGDDGVLWSIVRNAATPEPTSMFDSVNELARTINEEPEAPENDAVPINPVQVPDFTQYDWSEEYALASQPNGCSWTVLRSFTREKYKVDSKMVNALFAETADFPSALLEYFIVNDLMRKVSEEGAPIHVIAVPGAMA